MTKGIFIQGVVVVLIVIASTILATFFILSLTQEAKERQEFNKAKAAALNLDNIIRELLLESTGSRRDVRLDVDFGTFAVAGKENKIKYILEVESDIMEEGVTIKEGNLEITSGGGVTAVERDVDNDGNTDLVLENAVVRFAVQKMGSETSPVLINTSSFVTQIRNKRNSVDITPRTGIFINEKDDSSYGYGYTRLSLSQNVQSASIVLHLNSTANITYDAIFTLSSGLDFVEMEVHNIKGSV